MTIRFCDDRAERGFSWIVEEAMTRTSHALADGGRVWLVDPVDEPAALERATALGAPVAVVQLLDRHRRDCAAIAGRLGIPHLVVPDAVPDSPFRVLPLLRRRRWREVALWWEETRTLVVAEALGANPFFTVDGDALGVHGLLKPFPPRVRLGALAPEHVLVGHGVGVHDAAASAELQQALARSRLRVVPWALGLPWANRRARAYVAALARLS